MTLAKPARGRRKFPATRRPRITYSLATEAFEYSHGVVFSQEGGTFHVISGTAKERFYDRTAARKRFEQLVRINRDLELG